MKKILKAIAVMSTAAIACTSMALGGCTETTSAVGISEISYTSSDGNVDTYTIYYTDGTQTTFTVTNGVDGEDGEDGQDGADGADGKNGEDGINTVTVSELYEAYKNYYEETYGTELTYAEFISQYLTTSSDNSTSINSTLLSVASVYTEFDFTYYSNRPGSSGGTAIAEYTGSAILYSMGDEYSYFLTNYHVVYDTDYAKGLADRIHLYLYGSESAPVGSNAITYSGYSFYTEYSYDSYAIEGEYIGGSATSDIAVIRVKTSDITAINPDAKPVTLASGYHVGEAAYTVGNAEGYGLSVTEGIVSVDSENIYLSVDGTYRYHRSIRIDTALYSGNSGGGLFNKYGELIGVVNAGDSTDQNINYAIPLSIVTGTADSIIYYYEDGDEDTNNSYKVTLGISYTTQNSKYVYDSVSGYGEITEEIVISEITENSIAETIGLQADDILSEMVITDNDGATQTYTITRSFIITDLLVTLRAGYTISFNYVRDGETQTTAEYTILSSDLTARD